MPKKFSDLLRAAWTVFQTQWKTAAIVAVVFAVLMQLAQLVAITAIDEHTLDVMHGMSEERMEELVERMENGDQEAMNELMQHMGTMNPDGSEDELSEDAVRASIFNSVAKMLPALGLYSILALIIAAISQAVYLVLAIEKPKDLQVLFTRGLKIAPTLFGVWVWVFLRSFIWIPIIGIIPAIILGPRFALSPYLLVKENKSITATVRKSHAATNGYWGKIVGNSILMGLIFLGVSIVVGIPLALLKLIMTPLHLLGTLVLGQILTVFMMFFMVQLAETILKNPRATAK